MQLGTVVGRRPEVGVESGRLELTYPDDQQRRLVEWGGRFCTYTGCGPLAEPRPLVIARSGTCRT